MSKKPKQSRHRIPACALGLKSDPIDERYQMEVDMSTHRLERAYAKAQKALAAAEARAERARQAMLDAEARRRLREADLLAEQARQQQTAQHAREDLERVKEARRRSQEYDRLLLLVEDRRRELREIEKLMMPEGYGRDSRLRVARHESGAITIPLGATTGEPLKKESIPVFPVTVKHMPDTEPTYDTDFSDIYDEVYDYET